MPKVALAGTVVMSGKKELESTVDWEGNKKILGSVNKVNVALQFAPGATLPNERGSLAAGSKFTIVLKGVKPGSSASVGLSTKPPNFSMATASSKGGVKTTVTIPKSSKPGPQKMRLTLVDAKGKSVTLWFGVIIRN